MTRGSKLRHIVSRHIWFPDVPLLRVRLLVRINIGLRCQEFSGLVFADEARVCMNKVVQVTCILYLYS